LQDVQALHGPDYAKAAGPGCSPWTHRVVSRVTGQYRAEGMQLYPGQALFGADDPAARVLLCRFRQVPTDLCGPIDHGLRTLYQARPETAQTRFYVAQQPAGTDYLGIVELRVPVVHGIADASAREYLDIVNVHIPYTRRMAGTFAKET
jgi:hypothetical protein